MRGLFFAGLIVSLLVIGAGCRRTGPSAGPGPKTPLEVSLSEGGVGDIDTAAKQTPKSVVLVEFWSMASEPPADLALALNTRAGDKQQKAEPLGKDKVAWHGVRKAEYLATMYEGNVLRVVLVNVDGPEKKDEVLKFLKDRDVRHVKNIHWNGDTAAATQQFGFTGKVPHQVVFGRNGNRVWATGEPLPGTFDDLIFQELDK
jgi:hypothetical protein